MLCLQAAAAVTAAAVAVDITEAPPSPSSLAFVQSLIAIIRTAPQARDVNNTTLLQHVVTRSNATTEARYESWLAHVGSQSLGPATLSIASAEDAARFQRLNELHDQASKSAFWMLDCLLRLRRAMYQHGGAAVSNQAQWLAWASSTEGNAAYEALVKDLKGPTGRGLVNVARPTAGFTFFVVTASFRANWLEVSNTHLTCTLLVGVALPLQRTLTFCCVDDACLFLFLNDRSSNRTCSCARRHG